MTDESKKMLTLAEEVAKVLDAATKPLALASLKKGLESAGVPMGKGGVTKAQLDAALEAEGVYKHPSKKAGGKPSYWNKPPKSAEEIAAEAAAMEADAARKKAEKEAEKAAKPFRDLSEKVHAKLLQLGDKVVAGNGIGKPTAKAKPELHAEFERIVSNLLAENKLFAHPGGKYGRKPYVQPDPPKWYEKADAKKKIAAFIKAAEKVLEIEGATREWLLQELPYGKKHEDKKPPTHTDLKAFAVSVLEVARNTPPESRFYENKVYISAAWQASQGRAEFPKMSLADFKHRLVEANQQHLLNLSRANEVQMMNAEMVKESETFQLTHTFHFILV